MPGTTRWAFGSFELDADEGVLCREGRPVHLAPKSVGVLLVLVEHHGKLVDKTLLFDRVWPGVTVEECNLAQHVAALRRLLGDDARVPTFIETVSRRGYRFVAPVKRTELPALPSPPSTAVPASPEATSIPSSPPGGAERPEARPAPAPAPAGRRARLAALGGALVALAVAGSMAMARSRESPRTVALLPVANLTGDPRNMHLAALLGDALHQDLERVAGLRVDSSSPTGHGREDGSQPSVSGNADDADAVIESAVLSAGERVQVVVEVIEARSDALLWADVLEADRAELRGLENRLAQAVLARLRLNGSDRIRPLSGAAAARREHALARYYLARRTPHVLDESIEHFSTAVELDPRFPSAHAGLAQAYLLSAEHRASDPQEALRKAEAAARHAVELDPSLAEGRLVSGLVAEARSDLPRAVELYQQAVGLDRSLAYGHERLGRVLGAMGRHAEAMAAARRALELDPSAPGARLALATALLDAGQPDDALVHLTTALRLDPSLPEVHELLGRAHHAAGRHDEETRAYDEAIRLSGRSPRYLARLARALADHGAIPESHAVLREIEAAPSWKVAPADLARAFAALGQPERAEQVLDRAAQEHAPWLAVQLATLRNPELQRDGRLQRLLSHVRQIAEQAAPPGEPGEVVR